MVNIAKKPTFKRNFLIASAGLLLIAGGSYGGWRVYRKYEPPRLAKRARELMEKGDMKSASLTIRHAFTVNPGDVATNRLAAEISENSGSAESVAWRRRLVELEPGSLQAVLDCAETSLRFGRADVGKGPLEKMREAGKDNARYHELLGRTEMALGESAPAIEEFVTAIRLEPGNEAYQLERATALVERGWIEDRAVAQSNLERLSANPKLRLRALRSLLRDAMTNHEQARATILARKLAAQPEAQFADQMALLDLLHSAMSPDFPAVLASLKTASRGKTLQLAELLNWMNRTGQFNQAVEWTNDFTPEEWYDPRVCAAAALNLFATGNWASLESFTREGDWQKLDYIRRALLARTLRERGESRSESQAQWNAAVDAAAHVPHATAELARMIASWGWEIQYADLLRALLKDPKEAPWASQTLFPILVRSKDTTGLYEATARFMEANKNNDAAMNNFALYSLLLGRDATHASELAKKMYEKHPYEADYVSTYAYSLYVRGQAELALQTMKTLDPQLLQTPNLAAYYGILLVATSDWDRAPKFLDLAKNADLLPEEQALVRAARTRLEVARSEPE